MVADRLADWIHHHKFNIQGYKDTDFPKTVRTVILADRLGL